MAATRAKGARGRWIDGQIGRRTAWSCFDDFGLFLAERLCGVHNGRGQRKTGACIVLVNRLLAFVRNTYNQIDR